MFGDRCGHGLDSIGQAGIEARRLQGLKLAVNHNPRVDHNKRYEITGYFCLR
jgi:hypothetical protein